MQPLRVITAVGNVDDEAPIAHRLTKTRHVELVLRCLERTEVLAAVRGALVDVAIVVGVPPWLDPHALSEVRENNVRIVGVAADPLEADALQRLGIPVADPAVSIEEFLSDTGVPDPIEQLHATGPETRGRIVAVWGPKGGPGRSTVAVELAAEIAAHGARTALIDADTHGGDLAQMLAVVEELPTIVWAAQAASNDGLSSEAIAAMLRRTAPNGPVLLPGIDRSELWSDIGRYGWERLLDVFSASFDFSVIDVGFSLEHDDRLHHERDRLTLQTIGEADRLVAVCRADPVGVKTFLWSAERLRGLCAWEDVLIVANRVSRGDADEVRYILKKHLGKRPLVCLPSRPNEVRSAIDRGVPVREVKPGGEIAAGIRDLAAALGAPVPARGILTRLGGRS